jgi:hypothetical protein
MKQPPPNAVDHVSFWRMEGNASANARAACVSFWRMEGNARANARAACVSFWRMGGRMGGRPYRFIETHMS